MRESLRLRLVLWYGGVLALVVVLYGGAVVYQSWRSMLSGVDAELEAYGRVVADALTPAGGGRFDLELPAEAASYFFRREGGRPYYVIWSPIGELIDRSDPEIGTSSSGAAQAGRREISLSTRDGVRITVGRDITDLQQEHGRLMVTVAIAGLATVAIAILGGWFVAGRALAPIKRISRVAEAMSAGHFDVRIPVERTESELEQVASTLNDAFDRLRLAVEQERRFTADASHELRTPLSVLRAETEWALGRERNPQQYKDALAVCRRAALRMQDTVERLLSLVRAETTADARQRTPVALRAMIDDITAWLRPMAEERRISVTAIGEPFDATGDPEQLREALTNVIANAILYNKPGGSVTISARREQGTAHIEVVDAGIGIPADAVPRVFERFFRVDKARSREVGGSGLGLSIARSIFEAHGGTITCTSEAGVGSVFVIVLPTCAPATPPAARTRAHDS